MVHGFRTDSTLVESREPRATSSDEESVQACSLGCKAVCTILDPAFQNFCFEEHRIIYEPNQVAFGDQKPTLKSAGFLRKKNPPSRTNRTA
ncbi:TPA: hypothetical protein DEA21_04825 [Candidatus Uhrbacteria bacterium]|nr:hypothetical protein [Candidatus Uhrbacteria bacterium]HCU32066.1 hypothetical protein [Candidatus Uhrbacteria bacterium]